MRKSENKMKRKIEKELFSILFLSPEKEKVRKINKNKR